MSRDITRVELEGLEPSSARWSPSSLRPFPSLRLYGQRTAGSAVPRDTAEAFLEVRGLCLRSVVSPTVHRYFCCRAVVVRPRVPLLVAVSLFT